MESWCCDAEKVSEPDFVSPLWRSRLNANEIRTAGASMRLRRTASMPTSKPCQPLFNAAATSRIARFAEPLSMLKTASFFRIGADFVLPPIDALEEVLQATRFVPCGATQPESHGWIPPRGKKSTVLAEFVNGKLILNLCVEKRAVPASAVKAAVEEKIERYKQETGMDRVAARIKKDFKEEALLDLLPRAFTKKSSTMLWVDPDTKMLVVGTGSSVAADRVVTALMEALTAVPGTRPALVFKPVQTQQSAASSMSHWLASREAPFNFTVDRDCELKTPDEHKSTVRYSRHTLEIDEVPQHIAAGKVPTQLAMTWNDRLSFVLTESAQVKKIQLLDVVLDGIDKPGKDDDGFDTDAAIITGELTGMIPDLLDALGGELEPGAAPAPQAPAPEAAQAQ
jgi:recombination associated protein RdgC